MLRVIIILFFSFSSCTKNSNEVILTYNTDIQKTQIGYPVNLDIKLNNLDEYYSIQEMTWSDSLLWAADSSKVLIKNSKIEIQKIQKYDYFIINDNLELASKQLLNVIECSKIKTSLFDKDMIIEKWLSN